MGKYVRYDVDGDGVIETDNEYEAILWRVLRDDTDKVELITADALGEVDLTPTDFNVARTKYNNAVNLMVAECKRVTGIQSNIRNVGGPGTEEELSDTNTVDFNEYGPNLSEEIFAQYEGEINGLRKGDNNYEEDFGRMMTAGVAVADNEEKYYWLASRNVYANPTTVYFNVRLISTGNHAETNMCYVGYEGNAYCWSNLENSHPVRPVLTLVSGSLTGVTGRGTLEQPFEIYQAQ